MAERSLKVVVDATITGFVAKMRQGEAAAKSFAATGLDAAKRHEHGLNTLANAAAVTGAGLVGMTALAVKSAMDWESAWAGVTKTVDGTPRQLAQIESGLRSLVKTMPESHDQIAAVAEAAGQLGVKTESIVDFTKTMVQLGDTTNLSADEAATSIAQLMNVMQTAPEDVGRLGATLVDLGNKGASTERDIIQMAQNIAGAAHIVGMSEAEVLGFANALASSGIDVEAGGSAISKVMIDIAKAVDTSSPKLETWASVSGMTADQFAKKWKSAPAEAITDFVEGLGRMNEAGGDVFSTLETLGQSDIRVTRALLNMAGSGDMLRKSLENGDKAWQQNMALAIEAEKRYATTASKTKIAWNQIKDASIEAGEGLLPMVAKIAGVVGTLADAFGGLPDPIQAGLTAIAGIGGVSLLAMAGVIKLTVAIANMRGELALMAAAGGKASGIITGVGKAAAGVAVLSAVMAAGESVTARNGKEMDALGESLEKLGKTGKATGDLSKVFGTGLRGDKVTLGRDIRSIGEALKDFDKYGDDNFLTRLTRRTVGQGATAGGSGGIYAMTNTIKDMDAAFVRLSRNDPETAIKSFEELRDRALETGGSVEQLGRAFPKMTELMRSASEATGGAADSTKVLTGDLKKLAPAAQMSAEDLAKAKDAARGVAESFFDMGESLKGTLAGFGKALRDQATALRDFRKNAAEALARGADQTLVDYLIAQGPAGAAMLKQLADATHTQMGQINEDWQSGSNEIAEFIQWQTDVPKEVVSQFKTPGAKDAIATAMRVADQYQLTPDQVETVMRALNYTQKDIDKVIKEMQRVDRARANPKIDVNTGGALGKISALQKAINGLAGKSAAIPYYLQAPGGYTGGRIPTGFAGGGKVPGTPPADPREDNILAFSQRGTPLRVRSGEWIINEDASEKNDKWLRAINNGLVLPAFAGGGRHEYTPPAQAFTAHAFGVGVANSAPASPSTISLNGVVGELTITNWATGDARIRFIADDAAGRALAQSKRSDRGSRDTDGVLR